ncbi:MAG: zinc ribbon domain-containing protein [Lachnospiraceae bacterium]|nr:zinc ribbon domain-containing protein [Lachnospiraceae bacterium]
MGQGKIICPGCGAALSEKDMPFCPYCGRELIDLSRERTDEKISTVKRVHAETKAVPKKIAVYVTITFLILFLLFGLFIFLDGPDRIREAKGQADMDRLSSAMKKAYEKEDWEQLEEYLIYECEEYIGAPDYFCYRTAWFLHTYPPLFDEAYQTHDTDEMLEIYALFGEDYNMRGDDLFYRIYVTQEEIEEALWEEVEREKEILLEEGLEDEMYKLRF